MRTLILNLTENQIKALSELAEVYLAEDGPAFECMSEWPEPHIPADLTALRKEIMTVASAPPPLSNKEILALRELLNKETLAARDLLVGQPLKVDEPPTDHQMIGESGSKARISGSASLSGPTSLLRAGDNFRVKTQFAIIHALAVREFFPYVGKDTFGEDLFLVAGSITDKQYNTLTEALTDLGYIRDIEYDNVFYTRDYCSQVTVERKGKYSNGWTGGEAVRFSFKR